MNWEEFEDFFKHINKYTEQEIIKQMPEIKEHFRYLPWNSVKEKIKKIVKYFDKKKIVYELFKDEEKFSWWGEKLDISERLKFGLEIEVADLPLDEIKYIFKSKAIVDIMRTLQVPDSISSKIIKNSVFEKKNEYDKWNFSPEATFDESEASSPIFRNKVEDLNQIVAICTLLKALGATLHGGTGLHINIGVDYLECNKKAIDNVLKIWEECEELLFKMANKEGEVIRIMARDMAVPIKENIQDFHESDGSITLNTEEEMERFLYQIQAKNRMRDIVSWSYLWLRRKFRR